MFFNGPSSAVAAHPPHTECYASSPRSHSTQGSAPPQSETDHHPQPAGHRGAAGINPRSSVNLTGEDKESRWTFHHITNFTAPEEIMNTHVFFFVKFLYITIFFMSALCHNHNKLIQSLLYSRAVREHVTVQRSDQGGTIQKNQTKIHVFKSNQDESRRGWTLFAFCRLSQLIARFYHFTFEEGHRCYFQFVTSSSTQFKREVTQRCSFLTSKLSLHNEHSAEI